LLWSDRDKTPSGDVKYSRLFVLAAIHRPFPFCSRRGFAHKGRTILFECSLSLNWGTNYWAEKGNLKSDESGIANPKSRNIEWTGAAGA
jgi:hypothetical protein